MRILFDSKDKRYKEPFGTLVPGELCRLSVLIPSEILPTCLVLILDREDGQEMERIRGAFDGKEGAYDRYSVRFDLKETGLFFYYFRIETQSGSFALYRYGWDQTNMEAGDKWQLSVIPGDFKTPEELFGNIMYHIFPDRFAKAGICDTSGKLQPFWLHRDLNDLPLWEPDDSGEVTNCDFFGGNLSGITEKLDYLQDLGIQILYLNPIFKAWSNHRYDTADYLKIDELLGTEADFMRLCEEAHKRGMKIILDGVFSHTGSRSVYFDAKGEFGHGAVSDPSSPYRDWFDFKRYPVEYTAWWGVKTLPCVNELNEEYQRFIISGEDSVIAHWLRAGADGFRLDVADELPDEFIRALRARLKEIDPNSLLIGEVWEDASNKISYSKRRSYFTGGELDSVMNYPFKDAVLAYVTGRDSGMALRDTVMTVAENYPSQVLHLLMNMLSTHDTCRVLSLLSPSPAPEDKRTRAGFHMSAVDRGVAEERLRLAFFLQFVLPGMPCIFYGDEIGTEGYEDPFCRSFFQWDRVENNVLLDFVKRLSRMRLEQDVLKRGDISVKVDCQGRVWIERSLNGETLLAFANTGEPITLDLKGIALFYCNASVAGGAVTVKKNGMLLIRI